MSTLVLKVHMTWGLCKFSKEKNIDSNFSKRIFINSKGKNKRRKKITKT